MSSHRRKSGRPASLQRVRPDQIRRGSDLVYDINGLKRIPTWQTLNLMKDACLMYDRVEIEKIFKEVLQEAEEHGISGAFRRKNPAKASTPSRFSHI